MGYTARLDEKLRHQKMYDVMLMIVIHFSLFFVYSFICTHSAKEIIPQSDYSPIDMDREVDLVYEYGYPKVSRIHAFPTYASEMEMTLHDRYLVHGMLYTNMLNTVYLERHWSLKDTKSRNVCLNIFVKNRSLPYINVLIMSLMRSHESSEEQFDENDMVLPGGKELLEQVSINIINTERRVDRLSYDQIRRKVIELPFLNFHSTEKKSVTAEEWRKSNRLDKIDDFISSAMICSKHKFKWCLIVEEYAIFPKDFLPSLQDFVLAPLDTLLSNENATAVLSLISLFSRYDSQDGKLLDVANVKYSKQSYERDRGKLNSERKGKGLASDERDYKIFTHENHTGLNCALLFYTEVVDTKLIPFLQLAKKKEEERLWHNHLNYLTSYDGERLLDLEVEFPHYTNVARKQVEPSLINRIGFYDDERIYPHPQQFQFDNAINEQMMISNWITDPRFLFEAGSYEEGRDYWCKDSNDSWTYEDCNSVET